MSKVDVIIPFYNTPLEYIRAALASLQCQSFQDWTAIIADDGSTCESTSLLKDLLARCQDPRMVLVFSEHRGPAGSRNVAIAAGQSPYLAFLDSDDAWHPEKLRRQVDILDRNAAIGLVHSNYQLVDSSGKLIRREKSRDFLNALSPLQLFVEMLKENYVATSSVVFRRQLGEQIEFFDDSFPCIVDKDLWLRLLGQGCSFGYDPEILLDYRVHESNISKKVDLLKATRIKLIRKVDDMVMTNPKLCHIPWKAIRLQMLRHTYIEASEGYLESKNFREALRYSLPHYSGLSFEAAVLTARAVYRWLLAA